MLLFGLPRWSGLERPARRVGSPESTEVEVHVENALASTLPYPGLRVHCLLVREGLVRRYRLDGVHDFDRSLLLLRFILTAHSS